MARWTVPRITFERRIEAASYYITFLNDILGNIVTNEDANDFIDHITNAYDTPEAFDNAIATYTPVFNSYMYEFRGATSFLP